MLSALLDWIKNNINVILISIIVILLGVLIWRYYKLLKLKKVLLNINNDTQSNILEDKSESIIEEIDDTETTVESDTEHYDKATTKDELAELKTEEETDDNFDLNIDDIELSDTEDNNDAKSEIIEEIESYADDEGPLVVPAPTETQAPTEDSPKELIEEFKQNTEQDSQVPQVQQVPPKIKLNFKK
jgi:hypothetical protein